MGLARGGCRILGGLAMLLSLTLPGEGEAGIVRERLYRVSQLITSPSITVDGHGIPHLLYPSSDNVLHHGWREGRRWRDEPVDPGLAFAETQGIVVDSQDQVHVAYEVPKSETEVVAVYAVRRESGWEAAEVGPSTLGACIALGPDEQPRIFFGGSEGHYQVAALQDGQWGLQDTGLEASGWRNYPMSYRVDGIGKDHALYLRDGQAWYATNASGNWSEEAISDWPLVRGALTLDGKGVPHAVVGNGGVGADGRMFHHWKDEGGWHSEEVVPSGNESADRQVSGLSVDQQGHLFLSYVDGKYEHHSWSPYPRLAHFDGTSWREDYAGGPQWALIQASAMGPDGVIHAACNGGDRLQYLRFALPDLVGTWDGVRALDALGGARVEGVLQVRNQGSGASRRIRVALYLSDDDRWDEGDMPVGRSLRIGRLRPGGERRVHVSISTGADSTGKHMLAVLDPDGLRPDVDRPNNVVATQDPLE